MRTEAACSLSTGKKVVNEKLVRGVSPSSGKILEN